MHNKYIGSDFDDFLVEEGIKEEVEAIATKRVLAYQLIDLMKQMELSQTTLAHKMRTSRSAVTRLLDPGNQSVTLHTLSKAAGALGKRLRVELR